LIKGRIAKNLGLDIVRGLGGKELIVVELNAELERKQELTNSLFVFRPVNLSTCRQKPKFTEKDSDIPRFVNLERVPIEPFTLILGELSASSQLNDEGL
jgi:hypothetical protein